MRSYILESKPAKTMGLGGVPLERGTISHGKNLLRVFIKKEAYQDEVRGARILGKHLSVVRPIYVAPNHATFPDLLPYSLSLHNAVEDENIDLATLAIYINQLLSEHLNMWSNSLKNHDQIKAEGYSTKLDSTQLAIQEYLNIMAISDRENIDQWSTQAKKVAQIISAGPKKHGLSLTLGDENWGNFILRGLNSADISTRILYIDANAAGYRPWIEPLAKMYGWTQVAKIQCLINHQFSSVQRWEHAEKIMRDELTRKGVLNSAELEISLAAHLVTYLLRELYTWSIPRNGGKSKLLLSKAINNQLTKL